LIEREDLKMQSEAERSFIPFISRCRTSAQKARRRWRMKGHRHRHL
jgi:hypothetical protein